MSVLENFDGIISDRFVETGTGGGNSLRNASKHFKECLSVELDSRLHEEALASFRDISHVKIYHGNSPDFLREHLDHRIFTTFWLDAHYNGEPLPSQFKECPLLEELYEITRLAWKVPPIILIDDARIFLSDELFMRHPGYWKREEWPTVSQIDEMLPGYTRSIRGEAMMYEEL